MTVASSAPRRCVISDSGRWRSQPAWPTAMRRVAQKASSEADDRERDTAARIGRGAHEPACGGPQCRARSCCSRMATTGAAESGAAASSASLAPTRT